jgi:hypothetical protein
LNGGFCGQAITRRNPASRPFDTTVAWQQAGLGVEPDLVSHDVIVRSNGQALDLLVGAHDLRVPARDPYGPSFCMIFDLGDKLLRASIFNVASA